jgi:Ca2+-binding EF-hand superfamily protein
MSVSSLGASSNAYSYLQSLLEQQRASSTHSAGQQPADPLSALLNSFYSGADSGAGSSTTGGQTVSAASPSISPNTMTNLLAVQAQSGPQGAGNDVASRAQGLFGQFDTDGDGQISKSEFENAFGSGADMTKVDGLFNALDSNQDGAIGQNELTSAAESAASHHHHGHHAHAAGGGGSGDSSSLLEMLKSSADGSTTDSTSNADGSTTTTISYADGSKVSMTSPAGTMSGANADNQVRRNVLEQLIALQAQWSTQAASSAGSTSGTAAV